MVPRELAGPPATTPDESCWRLTWLRTGGGRRSALVTAQRRPGPGLPWIVHARWSEDKEAAWVIADNVALQPLPQNKNETAQPSPDKAGADSGADDAR
ncbi:hypothetical protein [Kitasatospora sp. NPDC059599]|uniref:hypothetical protein n=1 Tax=Kitasatospora sp. NPDC059599 TaxID=3346880 RepID=UPI0036D136A5